MTYFEEQNLCIRTMEESDIELLSQAFSSQGWGAFKPQSLFVRYYSEQNNAKHIVVVAVKDGKLAGYVILAPAAEAGPFFGKGLPEIRDFSVLKAYQRQGVGNKMMCVVEAVAKESSNYVSLAVGLYADYGTAQRIYVQRGYIPDGSGIWHSGKQVPPGQAVMNDDDLVLYLVKDLCQTS